MNRRSFLTSLFGGLAVAGIGGTAMAKSMIEAAAAPAEAAAGELDANLKAGLDQADTEFTQYHRGHPSHYRGHPSRYRHHRRPPPPPVHRRPRRVVRNGRVYYIR